LVALVVRFDFFLSGTSFKREADSSSLGIGDPSRIRVLSPDDCNYVRIERLALIVVILAEAA
jgi:hypothetical protein